jgi:hypothetical protein
MKVNKQIYIYIKEEKKSGTPDDVIKDALTQVGWKDEEINLAFKKYYLIQDKKLQKKPEVIEDHKIAVNKRSRSSNWVVWLTLIFFTFIILSLGGGYYILHYQYFPSQSQDYYDQIALDMPIVNENINNLSDINSAMNLDVAGISDINFSTAGYRQSLQDRFQYIPVKNQVSDSIEKIKNANDSIDILKKKIQTPYVCETPLSFIYKVCDFNTKLHQYIKKAKDYTQKSDANLRDYQEILPSINDFDSLLDNQPMLASETQQNDVLTSVQQIRQKVNDVKITSELKDYQTGLIKIFDNFELYVLEKVQSRARQDELAKDTTSSFQQNLDQTKTKLNKIRDQFKAITKRQSELKKILDEIIQTYQLKKNFSDPKIKAAKVEGNGTWIKGELDGQTAKLVYSQVTQDEDMLSNGKYFEWTFSNQTPAKQCGFISNDSGIIFDTRIMETGIFYSSDSKKPVRFINSKGEAKDLLPDDFTALYYYIDKDGKARSLQGQWTGKLVINKIDTGAHKVEGWLDITYDPFTSGGETKAQTSTMSGSFLAENCVK